MNRFKVLAATSVCVLAHWAGSACADAVTDWNEITVAAVTVGRPGPIGSLDIALVQLAVHDAVQAIDRRFEPYHVEIRAAKGSRSAAAAAAAHDVLVGLYPAQSGSLDASYHDYLANNGLTGDPGSRSARRSLPSFCRCGERIRIRCRLRLWVALIPVSGAQPTPSLARRRAPPRRSRRCSRRGSARWTRTR